MKGQTEEEWNRCQFCGNDNVEIIYENGRCNTCYKIQHVFLEFCE